MNTNIVEQNKVFDLINSIRMNSNNVSNVIYTITKKKSRVSKKKKKSSQIEIFDNIKGNQFNIELEGYKRFIKTFILKKGKAKKLETLVYKSTLHLSKKFPVISVGLQIKQFFNQYAFPIIYLEKYRIFKKRKSKRPFFKRKALGTFEEQKYIFNFFKEFFFGRLKGNLKKKLQFNFIEMTSKSNQLRDTQITKIQDSSQKWRRYSIFSRQKKAEYKERKKLKVLGLTKKKDTLLVNFFGENIIQFHKKGLFNFQKNSYIEKENKDLNNTWKFSYFWWKTQNAWAFKEKRTFNERLLLFNIGKKLLIKDWYKYYGLHSNVSNYFLDKFSLDYHKKKEKLLLENKTDKNETEYAFDIVTDKMSFSKNFLKLLRKSTGVYFTDFSLITKNFFWDIYKEYNGPFLHLIRNKKNSFRYKKLLLSKKNFSEDYLKLLSNGNSRKYFLSRASRRKKRNFESLKFFSHWNVKKLQQPFFTKIKFEKDPVKKIRKNLADKSKFLDLDTKEVFKWVHKSPRFKRYLIYLKSKKRYYQLLRRKWKRKYSFMSNRVAVPSYYFNKVKNLKKLERNKGVEAKKSLFFFNYLDPENLEKKHKRIKKYRTKYSWKNSFYIKGLVIDGGSFKKTFLKKPRYFQNAFFGSTSSYFVFGSVHSFGYSFFKEKSFFNLKISLKSWSAKHLTFFTENLKKSLHFKILQKNGVVIKEKNINKKFKRETLLTSPHVNKIAQQHFDLVSYQKDFFIKIPKKFLQKKESLNYIINIFNLDTSSIKAKIKFF